MGPSVICIVHSEMMYVHVYHPLRTAMFPRSDTASVRVSLDFRLSHRSTGDGCVLGARE